MLFVYFMKVENVLPFYYHTINAEWLDMDRCVMISISIQFYLVIDPCAIITLCLVQTLLVL